ncbi:MAG: 3-hydroxylacyl-ACP dehydratase [Bacteroidia bacterium]|nr:3-hydroxylacyl-ACP dehydratase [Bacteroidia bacterium]
MLQGTFFHILQISENKDEAILGSLASTFQVVISLDPDHPVYQGHFPGNPVVPGVCQIRMITEIISEITRKEVRLLEADTIKFLSMINPGEHPELTVDCTLKETEDGSIRVTASISDDDKVFFKSKSLVA